MSSDRSIGKHTNTYTTFSGADIVCTFGGVPVGSLMGIMWSITREKAPIYTMGSPNPRSFSRGKRGIAGTLMFTVFDRPGLYSMLEEHANQDEVRYFTRAANKMPGVGGSQGNQHRGIVPVGESGSLEVTKALPYYSDQIPPFDITITFANEYGQSAVRSLYGVEIINEGSGASMDDITIEETMTFVARDCGPMIATEAPGGSPGFSNQEGDDRGGIYSPDVTFGNS